ncbi:MAG: Glutamine cyclotransferase [Methanosaeta sp. PtaU1.Bin112]|nr:MAG: Glutamine cyclotransferase [Methanosaeta sp. PtaU1.Bin112]
MPIDYYILSRFALKFIPAIMLLAAMVSAAQDSARLSQEENHTMSTFGYEVVNVYPHSSLSFTQGLVYDEGMLYEGTGLFGQSTLSRIELETGRILDEKRLDSSLFGEGIALWKDRIVQLTWQSGLGLIYCKENMTEIGRFRYITEGWGITANSSSLIMSDGTDVLHILDPESYTETGRIKVTANGRPQQGINELEYVNGQIYANIWPTNWIAIISPESGAVMGKIDLQGILSQESLQARRVDVLNGIAYDGKEDRLFVTGKLWPKLFEIRILPKGGLIRG